MMKFIEKIFSGLAYQIGKFLFFVLLAIAICFLVDKEKLFDIIGLRVNAATTHVNLNDYQQADRFAIYNCSSATSCTTEISTTLRTVSSGNYYKILYYNNESVSLGTGGVNMIIQLNQDLMPGYLYNVTSLICADTNNISATSYLGSTLTGSIGASMAYSSTGYSQLSANYVMLQDNGFVMSASPTNSTYCSIYNSVISPKQKGHWLSLHLTRPSLVNSVELYYAGYQIQNLGTYSPNLESSITSIVQSTATQTQQQIEVLNETITEMTTEQEKTNEKLDDINNNQQQTNEKLDDINNTLTDSDTSENNANDFFDTSSISSSDGVVSALLTLPIQMANKLVNNLGGTCTPYQMNFGMLGKDYTLNFPCIDLEDYLGANLWHIIDLLFCGFMAYNIAMLFVSIYDSITSLQDYYYSYIYQSSHEEHTRENRRARTPSE